MTEPSPRLQRIVLSILTVGVAASRLVPLSKTPWDWDEVLFCMAVGEYDVAAHQPHPAGFPLFILLARIARLFADTDFHALQTVNVIVSMCVFPVMYWLARAFRFDFLPAVGAAVLFSFLPNVWFYGGTAFSDPLAMVLFLAAVAAYIGAGEDSRRYLLASVLFGAALLVRPQNGLVAVFPWTIATVRLVRAKKLRAAVAGTVAVALIVGIGYGLAAWATGFERYADAVVHHAGFVTRADSVVADEYRPPLLDALRLQLDPYDAGKASLLLNILAAAGIVLGRRRVVAELLLTFAPFFLFTFLAANPLGSTRFSLIYLPGIVLLAMEGTTALARLAEKLASRSGKLSGVAARIPAIVQIGMVAILAGRFATWVLPAFESPRTAAAPPTAAAQWLDRHAPRDATIFLDHNIWPWARYYVRGRKQVMVFDPKEVAPHPDARKGWYISMGTTEGEGAASFVRPRDRIWNVVVQRSFEAYVRPATSVVAFGTGWYAPEWDGVNRWRWGAGRTTVHLPPVTGRHELRLQFDVPLDAVGKPVHVRLFVDGVLREELAAKEKGNDVRLLLDCHGRSQEVVIAASQSFVPARAGGDDPRELAVMLRGWSWRRVA
ncbi:MAG TPA: hypothetical protein VEK57_02910 [Thermoanaerobaculia bacterium]|nr:hypothetical protein [Thermoanaerobaculia bacterium]